MPGYVARAVAAAADLPGRWPRCAPGCGGRMEASPLMDAPRFGESLAAGLRHAWRQRCYAQSGAGSSM